MVQRIHNGKNRKEMPLYKGCWMNLNIVRKAFQDSKSPYILIMAEICASWGLLSALIPFYRFFYNDFSKQ